MHFFKISSAGINLNLKSLQVFFEFACAPRIIAFKPSIGSLGLDLVKKEIKCDRYDIKYKFQVGVMRVIFGKFLMLHTISNTSDIFMLSLIHISEPTRPY